MQSVIKRATQHARLAGGARSLSVLRREGKGAGNQFAHASMPEPVPVCSHSAAVGGVPLAALPMK